MGWLGIRLDRDLNWETIAVMIGEHIGPVRASLQVPAD
jgi:hypothetical protein